MQEGSSTPRCLFPACGSLAGRGMTGPWAPGPGPRPRCLGRGLPGVLASVAWLLHTLQRLLFLDIMIQADC